MEEVIQYKSKDGRLWDNKADCTVADAEWEKENNPISSLFLNYQLSVLAHEHGFDKPCLGYYTIEQRFKLPTDTLKTKYDIKECGAPLIQQMIDWFEEKNIAVRYKIGYGSKHLLYVGYACRSLDSQTKEHNPEFHECGAVFFDKQSAINKAIMDGFNLRKVY